MPTLKEIIEKKSSRLETVPNKLISSVEQGQKRIFDELIILIEDLEVVGGKILLNNQNLMKVEVIVNKLGESVFGSEYLEAVGSFAGEFNTQAQINNAYFEKILGDEFVEKALYDNILKASQKNAIELLSDAGINNAFNVPLKNILNTSVSTGQSFGDTVKALRAFIEGNDEVDGTLLRHVKQVAKDGFSWSDAQYTNIIANDLGFEFYRYTGGTTANTREFCAERTGKYFHKKEIEGWGDGKTCCGLQWPQGGKWQGRIAATTSSTIFIFKGGWQCDHSILPVSSFSVPKEVRQRAIDKGYFKEA